MIIRFPNKSDLSAISLILDDTELFPKELLEEMIQPFFEDSLCDEQWFVCEDPDYGVLGFAFCRPEPFTEGVWNLLAIGIRTAFQGKGFGAQLITHVEQALAGARILLVETSGLDSFAKTRAFYVKRGYELVATIPEYWAENDDKVIFSKHLG